MTMKLTNLVKVHGLTDELANADRVLAEFEKVKGDTVPVRAFEAAHGYVSVPLLPVPKQVAVSAAKRERAKIVEQLRQLGVEVDDPQQASPTAHIPIPTTHIVLGG
jgi:hypothetical protein